MRFGPQNGVCCLCTAHTPPAYPGECRRASIGIAPVRGAEAGVVQSSRGGNRSQGASLDGLRAIVISAAHNGLVIIVIYDGIIIAAITVVVDKDLHLRRVRKKKNAGNMCLLFMRWHIFCGAC